VILHLAAQPLVRLSYDIPVETFATNVMGTVHLLDALRRHARPRVVLVVTSDKVYANDGSGRAFVETDRLGGHDPYSASKAATEIVVAAFRQSYFDDLGTSVVTARGGNVIGGGDFAADRLVPDILRALSENRVPELRNPQATRPWQHVLEPLNGYFLLAESLVTGGSGGPAATSFNFGPGPEGEQTVGHVAKALADCWGGNSAIRDMSQADAPPENPALRLDSSRAAEVLRWSPRWGLAHSIAMTADWYLREAQGEDAAALIAEQIVEYSK
jgi:CDP-glucose 4,6-dehydratase